MRKILKKIKDILYTYHPVWISMNYSYSKEWDSELNQLMDMERFIYVDKYFTRIGKYTLWIENYPYASFNNGFFRPSRKTIRRAKKRMEMDTKPIPDMRNEKINEILDIS